MWACVLVCVRACVCDTCVRVCACVNVVVKEAMWNGMECVLRYEPWFVGVKKQVCSRADSMFSWSRRDHPCQT
jgi:hypothetical protein